MARRSRKSVIRTFTSTGRAGPGMGRTRVALAKIGAIIPGTNQVYVRPRLRADKGIGGRSVRVTNPAATDPAVKQRTGSLGMGGVGQRGRNMDIE